MRGYNVDIRKVLAPSMSMAPSSAKSRELSISPGLDLHTPVGLELHRYIAPSVHVGRPPRCHTAASSLAAGSWVGSQYERNADDRARTPRVSIESLDTSLSLDTGSAQCPQDIGQLSPPPQANMPKPHYEVYDILRRSMAILSSSHRHTRPYLIQPRRYGLSPKIVSLLARSERPTCLSWLRYWRGQLSQSRRRLGLVVIKKLVSGRTRCPAATMVSWLERLRRPSSRLGRTRSSRRRGGRYQMEGRMRILNE
eukprot:COSAG01_NODE_5599_length_4154_cov_56.600986_2_plen_253_part_00